MNMTEKSGLGADAINPMTDLGLEDALNAVARRAWGMRRRLFAQSSRGESAEGLAQLTDDLATELQRLADAFKDESEARRAGPHEAPS
jgi:hypothetical protein